MFSIRQLYELQELDWNLSAREKDLEETCARLADNSALTSATRRTDELEAALAGRRKMREQRERVVGRLEQRLAAVDRRLYGGAITNPRELAASEEERTFLQEERGGEEDKLLELMVQIEELEAALGETRERLTRAQAEHETEHPKLVESEGRLTAEIESLRQARANMAPQIPPVVLSTYELLLKSRGGHAVARIQRSACQGCRITLPTMDVQRAKSANQLVHCNSCGRILYVV